MDRLPAFVRTVVFIVIVATSSGATPTLEQFFGLPNVGQPRISPDGKKVAFLYPYQRRMAIGVFDRVTQESRMVVNGRDESIAAFFWKGNDRIVFEADVAGNESMFIGSTDLTGRNVLRIAESQRVENSLVGTSAGIVDPLNMDPDHIMINGLFVENPDDTEIISGDVVVTRLNVRTKTRSPVLSLKEGDQSYAYIIDHKGSLRIWGKLVGQELVWFHRIDDGHTFKQLARYPFNGYVETFHPLAFASDNVTLWVIARDEYDRGALYAFDTRTMKRGPALFVPPEGEITRIITPYDHSRLDGVAYDSDRLHYHWFNPERAALEASLESEFKGCDIQIVSTSEDNRVSIVHVGFDREPGTYFVLDQKAGSLTEFKRVRDIDVAQMRPMEPITYTARDGLVIHGYLTRPAGSEGKRVPLIIHPHGGPFGIRDRWGFDPEVQFLASRGYAVLQPNYRGSGGYGLEFLNKGRCQWGRAMQDDLTDAVKWAIAKGIADPARIAIYGASYGGYAALAGVTLTPDLFCCAVNYVGAADLEITYKNRGDDAFRQPGDFSYQEQWIGPTSEYRAQTSPINLVERIKVPTFHAYGRKDPRVKIDHWSRLEPLLKKYHKHYESLEEPRQGHGFRDEQASFRFYRAMDDFLARNLAMVPSASAER